jgi:hypothetical protein
MQTHPAQWVSLKAVKKKKAKKARGEHQRINIRRSLRFFLRLHFMLVKECKPSLTHLALKDITHPVG